MPTRISASVGYTGSGVTVEIDVAVTFGKEKDDAGRWRDEKGRFTSPPDVTEADVRRQAEEVQDVAAANMRSQELAATISEADLSVEKSEAVGGGGDGNVDNVVRIQTDDGTFHRYEVRGNRMVRLD